MRILRNSLIAVTLTLVTYISLIFLLSYNIEKSLIKSLGLSKEQITNEKTFSNINFQILDNKDVHSLSFNLITAKISVKAKVKARKLEEAFYQKELDLTLHSNLTSYTSFILKLIKGVDEIDLFNHLNRCVVEFNIPAISKDKLIIELSSPNKRHYENLHDFLNDLPREYMLSIQGSVDQLIGDDISDFIKETYAPFLPVDCKIIYKIFFSDKIKQGMSFSDFLQIATLDLSYDISSSFYNYHHRFHYGIKDSNYNIDFDLSNLLKKEFLAKSNDNFNKQHLLKSIFYIMHNSGKQLDDDTKAKIEILVDTMIASHEKHNKPLVENDIKYSVKLSGEMAQALSHGSYKLHSYDSNDMLTIKLEGGLQDHKIIKGGLYVDDKFNSIPYGIEWLRLISLIQSTPLEQYNIICANYEKDIEAMNAFFRNSSDNPKASHYNFTYNIDLRNPLNITVNNQGKKMIDFIADFNNLFAPPLEDDDLAEK